MKCFSISKLGSSLSSFFVLLAFSSAAHASGPASVSHCFQVTQEQCTEIHGRARAEGKGGQVSLWRIGSPSLLGVDSASQGAHKALLPIAQGKELYGRFQVCPVSPQKVCVEHVDEDAPLHAGAAGQAAEKR